MSDNLQKVHGDVQPVFHMDTANGAIAASTSATGITTNFIGPAMDFFGIDCGTSAPTAQLGVGEAVEGVLKTIGQLATVMMYSVSATDNATNISVAVYPVGAWGVANPAAGEGHANLTAALQALGATYGATPFDLSGAVVTNVGFRLATTLTSAS